MHWKKHEQARRRKKHFPFGRVGPKPRLPNHFGIDDEAQERGLRAALQHVKECLIRQLGLETW